MSIDVRAADRALRAPASALSRGLHLPQRLAHGARENALRSLTEISRAVADRRQLEEGLTSAASAGDLGALAAPECLQLLGRRSVGRLAYVARDGMPDVAPVNYLLHNGDILIRSGSGPKLQAAQRREVVAFEVDDIDEQMRGGWSVVAVGRLSVVPPDECGTGRPPQPWANGPRQHVMRLRLQRVTGRRLLGREQEEP